MGIIMENQIVKIEDISIENAPAIYIEDGLKTFISAARQEVSEVPDLSTNKGRKRVASQAAKVSSSKKAVETVGRAYLKKLKSQPKIIEKELREFIFEMDKLRDETRQPLTEWETEEAQKSAKEAADAEAKRLAEKKESDHEISLLMNDKFDRDAKEAVEEAARVEKVRIEYEAEIKREAAAKAERETREALEREAKAKQEAIDYKWLLLLNHAHRDNDKFDSDKRAVQETIETEIRAEADRKAALVLRLALEQQAMLNEAYLLNDVHNAKIQAKIDSDNAVEQARLSEISKQEELAKKEREDQENREADKKHIGSIRTQAKESLIKLGLSTDIAKKVVLAISNNQITNVTINY